MAQILLKLCQGLLTDETRRKASYNHGSKVLYSLVRAISKAQSCPLLLVGLGQNLEKASRIVAMEIFFSQMSQIWLGHDQDLCVSSIWAGDGVLGTLVTNWAQPRSFSPKPSSTSQRCNELWDRNLKSLKCVPKHVWETLLCARIMCAQFLTPNCKSLSVVPVSMFLT